VIFSLATWRLASLISQEDGAFGILASFRHAIGDRYDDYSNPYIEVLGTKWYHKALYNVTEQLTCLWCCSVWVGVAWTILYAIAPEVSTWIALPFALSAVGTYLSARARFRKK